MPMNQTFDANQFEPNQGGSIHPPGTFDFVVSNTSIQSTKDETGGMFVVEVDTPAGSSTRRFNLWNQSAKAVEIAHGQLSALCRAVGQFQLDFNNDGAALRGKRGKVVIDFQIDKETKQPTQYTEIKKFLDVNGNEPGKNNAAPQQSQAAQNQQGSPPMQQNGQGTWGAPQPGNTPQPQPSQGWQGGNQQPQNQPNQPQGGGAWQPGNAGAAGQQPPWGK